MSRSSERGPTAVVPAPRRRAPIRCGLFALALTATSVAVAGCGSTASVEPIAPLDLPASFSEEGEGARTERWWTSFGHGALDSLVELALAENLDVRTAWERLREAEALVGVEAGALYPALEGVAGAELREGEGFAQPEEQFSLGLRARYEVDLWGRIGSAVQAERYRAAATLLDLRTVELTVTAEVVRTWCRLVEARSQVELLHRQLETNENVLELLEARFGSGQIRSVDILRQRQLVESTRERTLEEEGRVRVLEHALGVLLGRPPREGVGAPGATLPDVPALPTTGLPADLVQRRPDVRRAFAELQAADRDLAVAIARQYPRLDLSASVTTAASDPSGLFEDWIAGVAADLLAPLFNAGELDAAVRRREALKRQRFHAYEQAVLVAFREVEDALVLERKRAARIRSLDRQVQFARQAYEQLRNQYFNGLGGYLDVLTALTEEQELRRALLVARRDRLESRIALYRALAGPIEESPDPSSPEEDSPTAPNP